MSKLKKIYSDKQKFIYKETLKRDWFMLILHGAKRSGKTALNNDIFINELIRARAQANKDGVDVPMYILAGATTGTIYQNVLIELENKYGLDIKFDRLGNFELMGVYVVQVGHEKISGLAKIRGMTSYGAYINEATLANRYVFDEIISRCSGHGARIIMDMNPDHPEHFIKKEYIDRDLKNVLDYNWTIFDNPFLSERYVRNIIETTPAGMFTERNIYGNWTIAEGAIYKDYDLKKHKIAEREIPKCNYFFAGVDWGYEHFGAILVLGVGTDGKFYLIEEHAEQHKDIDYWVDIGRKITDKYGDIYFFCDSARPEHIARFNQCGLNAVNAVKNVLDGIEYVASLFKTDKLFISDAVKRFDQEINSYSWNKKTGKPIDENDDVMDCLRYALYSYKQNILEARRQNYSGKGARTN